MQTDTTYSLKIGSSAPDFSLKGTDRQTYSLKSFKAPVLVIVFSCNHCPYVQYNESRMIALQNEFENKVQFVAINANNAVSHPDDSFENMVKRSQDKRFPFPYVHDESQETAKSYGAQVTPEVFVFDKDRKLVYHGRIDANTYNQNVAETEDLKNVLMALLARKPVQKSETPATGCSIKWK
jgi:peroxiredoxin